MTRSSLVLPAFRSLPPLARAVVRGTGAGLLATVAMSGAMLALQKLGAMGRMPPQIITDNALAAAGAKNETPRPVEKAAGVLLHFGFGAVAAALFELARTEKTRRTSWFRSTPAKRPPYAAGIAFGGLVWTVSYMGWVPALGIMPPAHRDRPGRPLAMILAHVVYGASLARALG